MANDQLSQLIGQFSDADELASTATSVTPEQILETVPGEGPKEIETTSSDAMTNTLGKPTAAAELEARRQTTELDKNTGLMDTLAAAHGTTLGAQLWRTLDQKYSHAPEAGFDPQRWLDQHGGSIDPSLHGEFSGVRSTGEAHELSRRLGDDLKDQQLLSAKGARGMAAMMLAGMVDIDAPISFASGGLYNAGKAYKIARGAAKGAVVGGGLGAAQNLVDPLAETSDVVYGALLGAGLGGAGGAALNRSLADTAQEFERSRQGLLDALENSVDGDITDPGRAVTPTLAPPQRPLPAPGDNVDAPDADPDAGSVGARRLNADQPENPLTAGMSEAQKDIFEIARGTLMDTAGFRGEFVMDLMENMEGVDDLAGEAGRRLGKAIQSTPGLRSLYDDVAGGGTIMKALAYELLESPAGRARNNTSASALHRRYERQLATELVPIDEAYAKWAKQNGYGIKDRVSGKSRRAFDRQVLMEMNARWYGDELTVNPLIKQAADAMDAHYALDLRIKTGRDFETAVDGAMEINQRSGHYTRKWEGKEIRRVMRQQNATRENIEGVVAVAYKNMHPELDDAKAQMVAKAIVRRALASDEGMDVNMLMTLNSDGREMLRQTLLDSGYTGKDFDNLMGALTGAAESRGKLASNKQRIDLDMRVDINGISMMDLISNNISEITARNARRTAGAAALARKGITNKAQQKEYIDAAMREMANAGHDDLQKQREILEDMFSYFGGGAISGGVSPTMSRMKRLTNLVLLNQMGMTQLGETGAQIHMAGWDTWKRHAKSLMDGMEKGGPHHEMAKDIQVFFGRIGDEHLLFRPELQLEEMSGSGAYAMELDGFLNTITNVSDVLIGKGTRLQGYISGFNYVKSTQQKIAVTAMADKVFQIMRKEVYTDAEKAKLADAGIDPNFYQRYIENGTVEFSPEGYVDRLNMSKWDPSDADDFATALGRMVDQAVQRGMIGEDSRWWNKGWGVLFSHLKTFPLMAMQKQAARNLNMGKPEVTAAALMGLATAGMAYYARQIINGRETDTADVIKGAFTMSNITGWFPMMWDPVASILNMDDMRFNSFGRQNMRTGIVPTPAVIPTLNRVAHIPGGLNPLVTNKKDFINAVGAFPVAGNAYGMTYILNKMRD